MVYTLQRGGWFSKNQDVGSCMIMFGYIAACEAVILWLMRGFVIDNLKEYSSNSDSGDDQQLGAQAKNKKRNIINDYGLIMTGASFSVAKLLMFVSPFFLIRPSIAADNKFEHVAFRLGLASVEFQVYILIFSQEYVGRYSFWLLGFLLSGVMCKEMIDPGQRPDINGIHLPVNLIICLLCGLILLLSSTYLHISSRRRR